VKQSGNQQTHYGLGVIEVNSGYGRAVTGWNDTTATGRGAGWSACLTVNGGPSVGGVYVGGDAATVNGNRNIQRLAYFPG
jgi:hypothetical protein